MILKDLQFINTIGQPIFKLIRLIKRKNVKYNKRNFNRNN